MRITKEDIKRNPVGCMHKMLRAHERRTDIILTICERVHREEVTADEGILLIMKAIRDTSWAK